MEKADIRRLMRERKRALAPSERDTRSHSVMQRVEQLEAFQQAHVVLLYWSMDDEVQTHAFVDRWYDKKTILLPCVDGDELRLRQYTGRQCLVAGQQFGIGEPTGEEWTRMEAVEMIVVPGVAFDRQGNRMGRGRGFYDRLLKSTPAAIKVGVAFDFQIIEQVPTEPHDVRMNLVVSE